MTAAVDGFRGVFRDDASARAVYSEAAGIARIMPLAVAVPRDAADVVTLVKWAHDTRTPLIARGSGSSMAGGAIGEGVVVDLSRINEIGPVDAENRRVRVGPGALRGAVDAEAARVGLRFPIDPSSGAFCTIGGMAATNAAGAHTLRAGSMRPWVTALDCVFADGTRADIRRNATPSSDIPAYVRFRTEARRAWPAFPPGERQELRKDSSGYALAEFKRTGDLVDLLIGSEGTLAIFVGLELALEPRPAATASLLAAFRSLDAAVAGAAEARRSTAAACELLDRTFLDVAAAGGLDPTPAGTEAALLIEIEGESSEQVKANADLLATALTRAGAEMVNVALDAQAEHDLWELRHAASPILSRLDPALKSMQFIEDGAVPPERLADYVRGVRSALDRAGTRGVIFGHAGDAHVHVNPLIDTRDPSWRDRVTGLFDEVVALTARLGGTLTGEHGDGRLRTPVLSTVWTDPATLEAFQAVKTAFDPQGLLNPGVKVPLPGQVSLTDIKYDPALPPLPEDAARALARVERDRAYATSRLTLLADLTS